MKTVYIIRSVSHPDKYYVGITKDVNKRLRAHNLGQSPHTSKFRPWEIVVHITFTNPTRAHAFEKYLKTGSGTAFARKRFLDPSL